MVITYDGLAMTADLPLTEREMVAAALVPLDRLNELSMIAARGDDPGELSDVERIAFESMLRHVEQWPNVAWAPLDTTFV